MSRSHKPRKAYRPRALRLDTMAYVMGGVAKPSRNDREQLLQMVREPVKALREGVASEMQWAIAAGAVQLSRAIEAQGVVRGLAEHLASADAALQGIYNRAMASGEWRTTALYYQELDALQTFLELYAFQLGQLSRDEISRAARLAERQVNQLGHVATVAKTPQQFNLAGVAA